MNYWTAVGIKSKDFNKNANVEVMFVEIAPIVAEFFSVKDVKKIDRKRDFVMARQAIIWILLVNTNASLKQIGNIVGGFDHSTVIHARNNVINRFWRIENKAGDVEDQRFIACVTQACERFGLRSKIESYEISRLNRKHK